MQGKKHIRKLKAKEFDTIMNDKIKDVLVNHMGGKKHHNEMKLAFN